MNYATSLKLFAFTFAFLNIQSVHALTRSCSSRLVTSFKYYDPVKKKEMSDKEYSSWGYTRSSSSSGLFASPTNARTRACHYSAGDRYKAISNSVIEKTLIKLCRDFGHWNDSYNSKGYIKIDSIKSVAESDGIVSTYTMDLSLYNPNFKGLKIQCSRLYDYGGDYYRD